MSLGKKLLAGSIVLVLLLAVLGAVGVFVVAPKVAVTMVEERIARAEDRLGLQIETGSIQTIGLAGVEITDIRVTDPETGRTLVTVASAGGSVSIPKLLTGERVINSVWSKDVDVTITREKDGDFDIVNVLKRVRSDDDSGESSDEGGGGGILRHFGGTLPEMEVTDVVVKLAAVEGAPGFPVKSFSVPTMEVEHDDGIAVRTKINVESNGSKEWSIPSVVDLALVLSEDVKPQTMTVKFDRPLQVGGLPPYPFLQGGVDGLEISPDRTITVTDVSLGFRSADEPFLVTKRISVQLAEWALNPKDLSLVDVTVDEPRISIEYDELGASAVTDLDHAIRGPVAKHVAARARGFADSLAEDEDEEPEAPDDEEAKDQPKDEPKEKSKPSMLTRIFNRLPQRVNVTNANVNIVDDRELPVVRRARELELKDASLELVHQPIQGDFRVKGAFKAMADEQPRGKVDGVVEFGYRDKKLDADVTIDSLDLSWLGQILGEEASEIVRGGTLRGKLGVKPDSGRSVIIDGNISVENLVFFHVLLAEEPLTDVTASYGFSAKYNPNGTIPPAKLLEHDLFREGEEPPADSPIRKGSLVFTKGNAQLGAAKATVLPEIYGTAALPSQLPARFDLTVDLARAPVQSLFDSVPDALLGPLVGTQMTGEFAWKFELEMPLYRAAAMQWVSNPVLEEFELVEIPEEVDPQKLMDGFKLTIEDEFKEDGETVEWSRTVRIPRAEPIPAKYIVENGGIELETLDERRREREWPPLPDPSRSFLPRTLIESPEYWNTTHALQQVAKEPWGPNDTIERTEKQPYGPYVFVPLHHIAKWVVLTVTTTEDGGFFRHPGFLFDAIKDSVEDNIEASRFRRGASTISMQLVKNAFLDRKKLIARKLREAFLVWLMESVYDIPKSRILEVYFNIIEFGPGIYGIHDASVHYFGKRPDELTLSETTWLFSILPAPKKYHFYWDRGEISEGWWKRMQRRTEFLLRRDKITQEQLDAANAEKPEFYKPDPDENEPVLRSEEPSLFDRIPLLFDDQNGAPTGSEGTTDGGSDTGSSPSPFRLNP